MQNLENSIAEINQQGIASEIWIDGSFLTEKLNPDDADIALVLEVPTLLGLSATQRRYFDQFRSTSFYDQYRIDNYGVVLPTSGDERAWAMSYWIRQFGFSRGDKQKGMLRVRVPFLVMP